MNIYLANQAHKAELKQLWQHCFNDDDAFTDFWFDTVFKPHNTVIAAQNNSICGALQIVFYDISLHGNIIKSAYVCGVGVKEQYRKSGIGTRIMEFAHHILKNAGIELVFLISEADEFYKKLGYIPCCSKLAYKYSPRTVNTTGCIVYTNTFDVSAMKKVYDAYCEKFPGFIKRNLFEFEYLKKEYSLYSGGTSLIYINNLPSAYIIYDIENGVFHADEIAFTNSEGLYAVLDFIYNSSCKNAVITTAANDGITDFFSFEHAVPARTIWALSLNELLSANMLNDCFISIL